MTGPYHMHVVGNTIITRQIEPTTKKRICNILKIIDVLISEVISLLETLKRKKNVVISKYNTSKEKKLNIE